MRAFIIEAAQIADLHVLSLISENSAAAINYALNQRTKIQLKLFCSTISVQMHYKCRLFNLKQFLSKKRPSLFNQFLY